MRPHLILASLLLLIPAASPVASFSLFPGQPAPEADLDRCGGEAPRVTRCSLGTHYTLPPRLGLAWCTRLGMSCYGGTLVISAGDRLGNTWSMTCHVLPGAMKEPFNPECLSGGTLPQEHYNVDCASYWYPHMAVELTDAHVSPFGGVGGWSCTAAHP